MKARRPLFEGEVYFFPAGFEAIVIGAGAPPFGFLFFSALGFRFSFDGRMELFAITIPSDSPTMRRRKR